MKNHKIAVISDTHGILRPEIAEKLKEAELILHGGDIADEKVLKKLRQITKVAAVRGNADKDWAKELPEEICLELYGKKICMVHNKKHFSEEAQKADIVIFGHSHKYEETVRGKTLWLNPGSCGPRRFNKPLTMAMLEFSGTADDTPHTARPGENAEQMECGAALHGSVAVRRIELCADGSLKVREGCRWDADAGVWREPEQKEEREPEDAASQFDLSSGKLAEIVVKIVRDAARGKSVDQIVKAHKISRELAEQVCQIYFTHPGIDAEGVLRKMEIAGL